MSGAKLDHGSPAVKRASNRGFVLVEGRGRCYGARLSIEKRALSGSVAGAVAFATTVLQTLLFVPILLGAWGSERYGAWLALQALVALITTLDAGHQTYVGNELAKFYFGERRALRATLASGLWTGAGIGVIEVVVVVGLWKSGWLPHALGLSPALVASEHIALALTVWMVLWILTGSVVGVAARLYPPAGRYVRFIVWGLAARLVMIVAVVGPVWAGLHILGTTVVWQGATFIYTFFLLRDLRRTFPDLWPMHRGGHASVGAANFGRSLVLTGATTMTQLQQNGLNLLVTGALGVAALPVFATARTLASTFLQAANILCAPLAPEMVRFHVNREHDKLHATFAANWLVGGGAIELGLLLSLPAVEPLYGLWTRHALVFDRALFAFLAFAIALRAFGAPLQTYLSSINHLRAVTIINVVQAIVVLGFAAVGVRHFGLVAAGVAVLAGELVGSCALPIWFVSSELAPPWRSQVLRSAALAAAPAAITGAALGLYATHRAPLGMASLGVLGVVPLVALQWKNLPAEVRSRIVSLLRARIPVGG